MSEDPTPDQIMQVGLGFWASKALFSAVELELFTELAGKPATGEDLRERLGLHPRSALDFFDALVALGFLQRHDGVYRNTPGTEVFLDKRKPSYVGGILEMANLRLYGFWSRLTDALRTGELQNEAKGGGPSPFGLAVYADPARLRGRFSARCPASAAAPTWPSPDSFRGRGTPRSSMPARRRAISPCRWRSRTSTSRASASTCPRWRRSSRTTSSTNGVQERLRFAAGDFFADELPKADVLLMGHILHDWGLDEKRTLISKAHEALPEGGALIVYETIIDDDRSKNAFGLLMSLNMLIETEHGFDYTAADCMAWMTDAGFSEDACRAPDRARTRWSSA